MKISVSRIAFFLMFWLGAAAVPAQAAPDLVPILTAPQSGAFGVRNDGDTAAGPTLLLVGCNTSGSGPRCPLIPPNLRATYAHPAFPNYALVIRVPALQPGERFDHQVFFWNQFCWPAGTYQIPVQADGANSEVENNKVNNYNQGTFVSQRTCPTDVHTDKPDLRPILNNPPNGTVVVVNIGKVLTGTTWMKIYCRKEGIGNCPAAFGSPVNGLTVKVPGLRRDERFTYQIPFWNQVCWSAGSYQISVKVDSGGTEPESNETNNDAVSTLVVTRGTTQVTMPPLGIKICVPAAPQPVKGK